MEVNMNKNIEAWLYGLAKFLGGIVFFVLLFGIVILFHIFPLVCGIICLILISLTLISSYARDYAMEKQIKEIVERNTHR